ncbi:hypothetical protein [Yersinia rohdei]|uniref:hypothetical protein n=1 Tax=Yersinia rohdei TaxID=29485 RepID=UPI00119FC4C2|nr:hypothetical protein [Yersinia rohdei]
MNLKELDVFQELHIQTHSELSGVRQALINKASNLWKHDLEKEEDIRSAAINDEDVIVFIRESFNDIDESCLILWQDGNGYSVTNIVPRNVGELGIKKYNCILNDFYNRIVLPASSDDLFTVLLSSSVKTLEDFLDKLSIDALNKFSRLANKSTGTSHPSDEARWFEFLIKAHNASVSLDAGQLARWLSEVEQWPDEIASELAINYESSRSLLKAYDKS